MLRQRVITAIVLLGLLVGALAAGSHWPFALLTLVLIAAAGWEWGRLNAAGRTTAVAMGAALAVACLASLLAGWAEHTPVWGWWFACGVWVFGGSIAVGDGNWVL